MWAKARHQREDTMTVVRALLIWAAALLCLPGHAQAAFPARELAFRDIFAQRAGEQTIYCLLGNGFFMAPRSSDARSLVADWLTAHPEAQAIPVSIIGEGTLRPMVYVWLTDEGESLNLHLVRAGAFPADVMMDAVHFSDLSKGSAQQKSIQAGIDAYRKLNPSAAPPAKEGPPRRLLPDAAYADFLKQLAEVDRFARGRQLGVWAPAPAKAASAPD